MAKVKKRNTKSSDTVKLNSFQDLSSDLIRSLFISSTEETLVEETLAPLEETIASESLHNPKYRVLIRNKAKSDHVKDKQFSNRIEKNDKSSLINEKIINILKLDNMELTEEELPLIFDGPVEFENFPSSPRLRDIFDACEVSYENSTTKWRYKTVLNIVSSQKLNGELLRVLTQTNIENKTLEIIFIDPYHLLVTSNCSNYINVRGFGVCMSILNKYV